MTAITDLASASSVATGDYLVISQSGTDKKVTANKFGIQGQGVTFAGIIPTGIVGAIGSRASVAHNSAVQVCTLTPSSQSFITHNHMVTLMLSGTGRLITQTWLVTAAYSTITTTKISEANYGFTSVALTATINAVSGVVTLSVQQVNAASEAVGLNVYVVPLNVSQNGLVALAML